ncbi:MAG: hypothetical protein K1X53_08055 [Candidatus Sumerlaeaceae bacterium]|nr:hypothetical protein [Candidatus Sumerlaeaceae bacterium]
MRTRFGVQSKLIAMLASVGLICSLAGAQQYSVPTEGTGVEGSSAAAAAKLAVTGAPKGSGPGQSIPVRAAGQPNIMRPDGAFSAAVMASFGGRGQQFSEATLLGDWDGREDNTADRQLKVADYSGQTTDPAQSLTRVAVSEHTIANGFNENVFYIGDSLGNVRVAVDTDGNGKVDKEHHLNLPTILNAFGNLNSDDQIVITGVAVNPVADHTAFSNVNGAFTEFAGKVGEMLYVSFWDTGSGFRLAGNNTPIRSGLLAFPILDEVTTTSAAVPAIQSPPGFPITVGGSFAVIFSTFSNPGGIAVDDDGSVYFHQADLIQFTGGNIVKIDSTDSTTWQDRSLAVAGILTITTLNPSNQNYGSSSGPSTQRNTVTNYSGTSTFLGNIVALACAPGCSTVYAAVARSLSPADPADVQATEGLFPNPPALGATPSMIIAFADNSGGFDECNQPDAMHASIIPIADGKADSISANSTSKWRAYVLGDGPDVRGSDVEVFGTTDNTLKVAMQIDYSIYSGLMADEDSKLFVVSGGTPPGLGQNPSPKLGEILVFEDRCPKDARADYVDFRGDNPPNPPASGGNTGDGDSDRYDHIYQVAPIDQVSFGPTGIAGLSRGFLRYTNRLAPNAISDGVTLGQLGGVANLGDDDTAGPIVFEAFDPGHQVAGGDDQNSPFRGDDNDGAGDQVLTAPLNGGFEFAFGGPVGTAGCVHNVFFLNSNGSISFGSGDTDNTPVPAEFRSGVAKIAPAFSDLNPAGRATSPRSFPVQALGFANVNHFKIRDINVPEFGNEGCGSRNNFSLSLFDDGVGIDENANQPLNPANPIGNNAVPFDLQEGPTDLRFEREEVTQVLVGCNPRLEGTGQFFFDYGRMDTLGTSQQPVLVGYSIGNLTQTVPPGLCPENVSALAVASDSDPFRECLLGEGTEPTIFEFFNTGVKASVDGFGNVIPAVPAVDLKCEGLNAQLSTPGTQSDTNREVVGFYGIGCAPPPNPQIFAVVPDAFATTPGTTGLINVLCGTTVNLVGCGILPNEVTTVCQGDPNERPGKTVTAAVTLNVDTNGDNNPDTLVVLTNVTPISEHLVRATLVPFQGGSSTPFALNVDGGIGNFNLTSTFTAGDNNVFGPFIRTAQKSYDLGTRAPIVTSITPPTASVRNPLNAQIEGSNLTGATDVFLVDTTTRRPLAPIHSTNFVVQNENQINAVFTFGRNVGRRKFLVYVTGPGGTSRNLNTKVQGAPADCPLGNELGSKVTFTPSAR